MINADSFSSKIKENISLAGHTTFRIGGFARYFFEAESKEDLIEALRWAKEKKLPYFILGGGSNLLVSDEGFEGIVIKIKNSKLSTKGGSASGGEVRSSKIVADAGTPLNKLVSVSIEAGLSGLEWAAGIPGTIGGAIRGNAGAYGGCTGDVVDSVEVLDVGNQKSRQRRGSPKAAKIKYKKHILKIKKFSNNECCFAYRSSIFKQNPNLIILSAEIKLEKRDKNASMEKIKEFLKARIGRHPVEPSAGCVFKNILDTDLIQKKHGLNTDTQIPQEVIKHGKIPVAWLIEQCGLKGEKIGGAMISEKHANYIINLGNARANDVKELINLAKEKVKEKFGIGLEEEIQIL